MMGLVHHRSVHGRIFIGAKFGWFGIGEKIASSIIVSQISLQCAARNPASNCLSVSSFQFNRVCKDAMQLSFILYYMLGLRVCDSREQLLYSR